MYMVVRMRTVMGPPPKSHKPLLIRVGFFYKLGLGLPAFLPLRGVELGGHFITFIVCIDQ